jgi:hypothetical protein
MPRMTLAACPPSPVDDSGRPAIGAYRGHMREIRWDRLVGADRRGFLWRLAHAKSWHYVSVAGPRAVLAVAIIDAGYAASCFAYLFDRTSRTLLADLSSMGAPGLSVSVAGTAGEGAESRFRGPRLSVGLARKGLTWRLAINAPRLQATVELDATNEPPTLCAVARIEKGVANCTHKTACLPARGEAIANGVRISLDGHTGALDHTSGLLARETVWRWANAAGPQVGLNLVEGFNGPVENVVWQDGELHKVGAARILHDDGVDAAWKVTTDDGAVDLVFTPEGARREDKNLVVARSRYVQPIGTYRGTIRGRQVTDLVGVTEDHLAVW